MSFPLPPPQAPLGCAQCANWARTRQQAQAAGDLSRVIDMNVLIRRHHPPTDSPRRTL
ncbi:hypothetical protein ACFXAZ_38945 [Streptomyces sp. NPDC059477]|uniref:hypothetical protein n=1 Tax=Streptomyces sp. NPDC059477 TaxID=3346847 RepID=UPI0036884FCC